MSEIIYTHKEKCIFLTWGVAQGKAVIYKEAIEKIKSNELTFIKFFEELKIIADEEMIMTRQIIPSQDEWVIRDGVFTEAVNIIHKEVFFNLFKTLVFIRKYDIWKAFLEAYDTNKVYVLSGVYRGTTKESVNDTLEYIKNRISSLIHKVIIKDLIKDINEDFIFITDDFRNEIFDDVSRYLKGIICTKKQKLGEPNLYAIDFGIPLVVCAETIDSDSYILIDNDSKELIINPTEERKSSHLEKMNERKDINLNELTFKNPKFRIFASTVDTLSIDSIADSNNYHGLCAFRTEYYYAARGIAPSLEEQIEKYVDIIHRMGSKEVYFEIPRFDHIIKLGIMKGEITDLFGMDKCAKIFEAFLDAVAAASAITNKKLSIVIPSIIRKNEVSEWLMHVEHHFSKRKAQRPFIGGVFETEAPVIHFADFKDLDFVIVSLDDVYDEIDDDFDKLKANAHIEMIDQISMDDLRRMHRILQRIRSTKRHILHGNVLTNPEILHKFLKRGFKEFSIPANKMHLVYDVFKNHLDNVGKYIGYRAMQKAKKERELLGKKSDDDDDDDR
jgi:phosphoenolpyruvate-protein kinase (PTS system EI component)